MVIRKLRLITGLILFVFVLAHLANVSLGLISVGAMDRAKHVLMLPWFGFPGGVVLAICLMTHGLLGFYALFLRSSLRMNYFDAMQLLIGLSIPVFLLPHAYVMIVDPLVTDDRISFADVLLKFWVDDPWMGLRQVLGVLAVWVHACMGLFVWMRLQSWWFRIAAFAYPLVVVVPVVALLGFAEGGKEVIAAAKAEAGASAAFASRYGSGDGGDTSATKTPRDSGSAPKPYESAINNMFVAYVAILIMVLLLRWLRLRGARRPVVVKFRYGPEITASGGISILEVSRANEIPHGSLCGGKARCGTCQVRVHDGAGNLSTPTDPEKSTLARIHADDDVRLACQAKLTGGRVEVERLLPHYPTPNDLPVRSAKATPSMASMSS